MQFSVQDFSLGLELVRGQSSVFQLAVRQVLTIKNMNPCLLLRRLLRRLAQCRVGVRQHVSFGGEFGVLLSELAIFFLFFFDLLAELIVQLLHLVRLNHG